MGGTLNKTVEQELATYRQIAIDHVDLALARDAEIASLREKLAAESRRADRAEGVIRAERTQWPQSVATLEAAMSTFPAGRYFLERWTLTESRAAAEAKRADAMAAVIDVVRTGPVGAGKAVSDEWARIDAIVNEALAAHRAARKDG